ncbi:MAG TPA: ParA family protein [Syntrophomonas sp.]|nr:ParA family protein [Syntrophomonas sp.]
MAKIILLVSVRSGSGQSTTAVNLASGLARKGYRVLVAEKGKNSKLRTWLGIDQDEHFLNETSLVMTIAQMGFDFWGMENTDIIPDQFSHSYDYIILLPASASDCITVQHLSDHTIVCSDLNRKDASAEVISFDRDYRIRQSNTGIIDLIVLNKVNTKEWHHNAENFSLLTDYFGCERIADPIPHCERIHDLPLDGRTVWELSQDNLRDAFMRLTETVVSL